MTRAKPLAGLRIADHHGQVEAQVGDVRERVRRIEGQRRQRRKNLAREVTAQPGFLVVTQLGPGQNRDTAAAKLGRQVAVPAVEGAFEVAEQRLADGGQLLQRGHAVRRRLQDPAGDLAAEPGHPNHEKFVEVGGENGEEFDPLKQGIASVQGLFKYPPVELQPGRFPIDVETRVLEIDGLAGGLGLTAGHGSLDTTRRGVARSRAATMVPQIFAHGQEQNGAAG